MSAWFCHCCRNCCALCTASLVVGRFRVPDFKAISFFFKASLNSLLSFSYLCLRHKTVMLEGSPLFRNRVSLLNRIYQNVKLDYFCLYDTPDSEAKKAGFSPVAGRCLFNSQPPDRRRPRRPRRPYCTMFAVLFRFRDLGPTISTSSKSFQFTLFNAGQLAIDSTKVLKLVY
jgi:hypothetical protein